MGLFSGIISIFGTDDTEIALQLFESQGVGGNVGVKAKRIIASCKNRQEVLLKAIELCGPNPISAKQLYIVSHCYVWLGAKYRTQAIEFLEKYIAVGALWSGTPRGTIKYDGYSVNQLDANKASVYNYLGEAYEGEYEFEKAEQAYKNAEKIEPHFATYSVNVAKTYVKRNDLSKALLYLQGKKNNKYYKKDIDDYKSIIDKEIADISSKIKKGYTYKPRNKKKTVEG